MKTRSHPARRLDVTSLVGLALGVVLVLAVQGPAGGTARSLLQVTAFLIVFGGTASAVLLSFSLDEVLATVKGLAHVFSSDRASEHATVARIVRYAARARREGIIALDRDIPAEPNPFLRKALTLAVDGTDPLTMRDVLDLDDANREERDELPARVLESAGGFAPTFGILGAVLGLIHVMENLADPSKLGTGIAVAFVATVYGLGSANLLFLPMAAKLRGRARQASKLRELVVEGVLSIQEGLGPRTLEERLGSFATEPPAPRPHLRHARVA